MIYIVSLLSTVLATLVGAFSGGGTSLVLFPLLLIFAEGSYASLLTVTKVGSLCMTLVSGGIHAKRHNFDWGFFSIITAWGILGTALGTYLVQFRPNPELFKQILGVVLIATAVFLLFARKKGTGSEKPREVTMDTILITSVFCFVINILNGLFGGTGIFLTIYLVSFMRMTFIHAIAYMILSYVIVNIAQVLYLLSTESVDILLTIVVIAGAVIGSWSGTHLQYLKGNAWVKRVAVVMMIAIGVKVLT